jgi:hypothetical protein
MSDNKHLELKLPTGERLWFKISDLMRQTGMTREEICAQPRPLPI